LFGGVDPASDFAVEARALGTAELVVAVTTHLPESLRSSVHVVLPIGTFAETSGTFVNAEGRWQSWAGAAKLPGESRPGWKVLRVLANLLNLHGVDYVSSDEIREALKALCGTRVEASSSGVGAAGRAAAMPGGETPVGSWVDIPPYQCDALVRGSDALSKTKDGRMARTVI
jgi:NADH-quinone oxidoreductase subunit G